MLVLTTLILALGTWHQCLYFLYSPVRLVLTAAESGSGHRWRSAHFSGSFRLPNSQSQDSLPNTATSGFVRFFSPNETSY